MSNDVTRLSSSARKPEEVERHAEAEPSSESNDVSKKGTPLPPEAVRFLAEFTEMRASLGPDAETARIFAETERYGEEKKLEGFKATLDLQNQENERKHIRHLKRISNESLRSWVVLVAAIIAAATGVYLSLTGKSSLGVPLLVFAGVLIKDLTGKPNSSNESD